jgi:hypothetical protein
MRGGSSERIQGSRTQGMRDREVELSIVVLLLCLCSFGRGGLLFIIFMSPGMCVIAF